MATDSDNPPLKILHVLTLNGRNGEYGGPVRVAREHCRELNLRGHSTHIFSGALRGSEPSPYSGLDESYIYVNPLFNKLRVSSLWSWRLIPELRKLVIKSDLVHIHFARDLVPFFAALLSIIFRKPFITQTHGMIISDARLSTRLTDLFLTKPLMNRSRLNLVLTENEEIALKKFNLKSKTEILPNGIAIPPKNSLDEITEKRIVFCSRLDKRKGIDKFITLAENYRNSNMKFEVYGPDGGQLNLLIYEIEKRRISNVIEYKGSLSAESVLTMLQEVDLLVLPSKDEPFPMIILEALSVGTNVLIMPSCGFAPIIKNFESNFVSDSEDLSGLLSTFRKLSASHFEVRNRIEIRDFCRKEFGISKVADQLISCYRRTLSNE